MRRYPNLLFVFADQMRGMDMACAGNPDVRTPAMDRLASEGTRFSRAYANTPVCTPSRASLLTGRYPLAHRTVANDLPLPDDMPTIGEALNAAGYRTGYVGKWHLDGVPRSKFTPPGPRRHGFDHWAAWNCSHDYFHAQYHRDSPEPIRIEGYEPEGQTDLAREFLRQSDDHPFCLFLSWGPPHDPYPHVPERLRRFYDPERITLRPNVRAVTPGPQDISGGPDTRRTIADYYAAITALDEQLGRLTGALDELRLADDTVVVFTSDHGDMLWSQGRMKKQQPWEEAISIPFLIRWPGRIPAGRECPALLSVVDMAPSLLGLLGVVRPDGMQGTDLSRVMLGQSNESPESVFLSEIVTTDEGWRQGVPEWRGVRTARYTYACAHDGQERRPWLLYDNEADPYQVRNVVDDPRHPEIREELHRMLLDWLDRTGDAFLPGDDHLRELGLVDLWDAREASMHPNRKC